MRALLAIIAVLAILFAVGWITLTWNDDAATITIETGKMKQEAQETIERGEQAIQDVRESIDSEKPIGAENK